MNTARICHIVIVPACITGERVTLFQGFSDRLVNDYNWIFDALSYFPNNIIEIFQDTDKNIALKIVNSELDIDVIREDLIIKHSRYNNNYFNVLWTTESTHELAEKISKDFLYKPIHISSFEGGNCCTYAGDLDGDKIKSLLLNRVELVVKQDKKNHVTNILSKFLDFGVYQYEYKKFPFTPVSHNCTLPLIKTIQSCGYEVEKIRNADPSNGSVDYIKAMEELAEFIISIREKIDLNDLATNDAIVYSPSMYANLYSQKDKLWKEINKKLNRTERLVLRKLLIRNEGYSSLSLKSIANEPDPRKSNILSSLISERKYETELFSQILAVLCTSQFTPGIRLPNSVMLHHDLLKNISNLIKSAKTNKLPKLFQRYSELLKQDIGDILFNLALKNTRKILIVCDYPLEWIKINRVPLMFTHEVSKVPSTPGGNVLNLLLGVKRQIISYSIVKDILIISSFKDSDPIRNSLLSTIYSFQKNTAFNRLSIVCKQVNSEEGMISALNNYRGAIVIFDCHGNHGGNYSYAWLDIGNDRVNTWELANKCRIPPIVILSACSTHAIDGSHATVANGFFRSGATTVIGTFAPIEASHAALFVCKLLNQISVYLPKVIKSKAVSWREFISIFFKASYVHDILHSLHKLNIITDNELDILNQKTSSVFDSSQTDWYLNFFETIIENSKLSEFELNQLLDTKLQFVESMLYTQLGRPDRIFVEK